MIQTRRVHPYVRRLFCDSCEAEMGEVKSLRTNDTYTYRCPRCKSYVSASIHFPEYIDSEEIVS